MHEQRQQEFGLPVRPVHAIRRLRSAAAASPLAVAAVCLAGSLAFTWPLAAQFGSALPGNLVDPLLNAIILGWNVQWMTGARPGGFWDAPIFHPQPDALAYSEHLIGQTLFVWPVFALTGNAIATYNAAFVLSFVITGVGAYLLLQTLTGRRDVAFVFAVAIAFSPVRMGAQVARLQMLSIGWLPLALWAIHRYGATARSRYLVWLAVSLLLLVLSNMYMIFLAAVAILLLMGYVVSRAGSDRTRILGGFSLTGALVVLLLVPVVEPYRDLDERMGLVHREDHIADYSAHLTSYVSAHAISAWLPWATSDDTGDQALYPGALLLLPPVAALLAALLRRGVFGEYSRLAVLYGSIGAVAACLSFGPIVQTAEGTELLTSPYSWLHEAVPGLAAVRAPGRFGLLVGVALAVIGALVTSRLFARLGVNARGVLMAGALGLVSLEALPVRLQIPSIAPSGRPIDVALYDWLARQPPSALLELPASPLETQVENVELLHQFATLQHPHRLVNGYSGFNPPLADLLEAPESPFADAARIDEGVALLRSIHVRFVVIHVHDYASPGLAATIATRMRDLPGIVAGHRFGEDFVFELSGEDQHASSSHGRRLPVERRLFGHGGADAVADTVRVGSDCLRGCAPD